MSAQTSRRSGQLIRTFRLSIRLFGEPSSTPLACQYSSFPAWSRILLARVLSELIPEDAERLGLLALMLLQDSRRDARIVHGGLITLEEQDRPLCDRSAIAESLILVEKALKMGPIGRRIPPRFQLLHLLNLALQIRRDAGALQSFKIKVPLQGNCLRNVANAVIAGLIPE
jgi:hypothetical protein